STVAVRPLGLATMSTASCQVRPSRWASPTHRPDGTSAAHTQGAQEKSKATIRRSGLEPPRSRPARLRLSARTGRRQFRDGTAARRLDVPPGRPALARRVIGLEVAREVIGRDVVEAPARALAITLAQIDDLVAVDDGRPPLPFGLPRLREL